MLTHYFSQAQGSTSRALAVFFSVTALLCQPLLAQTLTDEPTVKERDRWYQIEVILLAHKQSVNDEIWRSDIALAYPPNWVELKDPEKYLATEAPCQPVSAAAINAEPALPDDYNVEPVDDCPTSFSGDESNGEGNGERNGEDSEEEQPAAPLLADLDREPYYTLPKELRALNDQVQELKWSKQHRVLFHQAWRQPVLDKSEATSIIISAGDQFGDNAELEGTISINVSRYLHLNTNLWFSEFSHNYGQDKGQWPELPARPDLQDYASVQIEENATSPWDKIQPLSDEYDKILAKPYIPERITLIKQKRRMRSKEVHYIDHPKVGLVILIEPYEVPALIDEDTVAIEVDADADADAEIIGENDILGGDTH